MEIKTSKKVSIWSASYGKEPFDLRLTVLRIFRNLPPILVITLIGTLVFGGGYYVKNVLLAKGPAYVMTSTYKVSFANEPSQAGDYYINEMTWNTYVHSEEFLTEVYAHLEKMTIDLDELSIGSAKDLALMIEAKLDSDIHVPSTIVTTGAFEWTLQLAQAVEQTMTETFVKNNEQLTEIRLIDRTPSMKKVLADEQPRPVRAFILAALLSGFFAVVCFLLKEMGNDDIWLPATLRRRYGLNVLGTINGAEFAGNLEYAFRGKNKIAVCAVSDECNPVEIVKLLEGRLLDYAGKSCKEEAEKSEADFAEKKVWVPIPAPLLCPEAGQAMRETDGVLLVAEAGSHAGRPLEYVLEYLATQEVDVTAALLWDADESLIRAYYMLPETSVL